MKNQLIVTKDDNYIYTLLYNDSQAVQINASSINNQDILGNIYIGKVKNIVKNIGAAFIEIKDSIMCYYSMSEDVPPIILNRVIPDDFKTDSGYRIKVGDELLVQVKKEAVNAKAPVVTGILNITGRYIVLTHGKTSISISNKITLESEIIRIRAIIRPHKNSNFGLIARTNCLDATESDILKEIHSIEKIYNRLIDNAKYQTAFSLVYQAPLSYICDIRDCYSDSIDEIITNDKDIYNNIFSYLDNFQKQDTKKLILYGDETISLNAVYGINSNIKEALKDKIWLKSGGTIVIQPTEALIAIDVNTSKAIAGKADAQKAFLSTNLEAAKEIARQLRLRNLGGIIIVDFIDLKKEEDKKTLLEEFSKMLLNDPIKTTIIDMTGLNLVEITRKKVRKPLYQQLDYNRGMQIQ